MTKTFAIIAIISTFILVGCNSGGSGGGGNQQPRPQPVLDACGDAKAALAAARADSPSNPVRIARATARVGEACVGNARR